MVRQSRLVDSSRVGGLVVAALSLTILYIWSVRRDWPYAWVPVLALIVALGASRGETPGSLGFSSKTFRAAARALWPAVMVCAAAILLAGVTTRSNSQNQR